MGFKDHIGKARKDSQGFQHTIFTEQKKKRKRKGGRTEAYRYLLNSELSILRALVLIS